MIRVLVCEQKGRLLVFKCTKLNGFYRSGWGMIRVQGRLLFLDAYYFEN